MTDVIAVLKIAERLTQVGLCWEYNEGSIIGGTALKQTLYEQSFAISRVNGGYSVIVHDMKTADGTLHLEFTHGGSSLSEAVSSIIYIYHKRGLAKEPEEEIILRKALIGRNCTIVPTTGMRVFTLQSASDIFHSGWRFTCAASEPPVPRHAMLYFGMRNPSDTSDTKIDELRFGGIGPVADSYSAIATTADKVCSEMDCHELAILSAPSLHFEAFWARADDPKDDVFIKLSRFPVDFPPEIGPVIWDALKVAFEEKKRMYAGKDDTYGG